MTAEDYFKRGNAYLAQKRYQKAIKELKNAVKVDPKYCEAWINMGLAQGELGEHKKAIDCYQKAVNINPK